MPNNGWLCNNDKKAEPVIKVISH